MTSTSSVAIVSGGNLTTAFTDLYTVVVPSDRIVITAAVFNNYSSSNATLTLRVVQVSPSDTLDEIVTEHEIRAKESFLIPGLIGQSITVGGKIEAKASANTAINANITATLIT